VASPAHLRHKHSLWLLPLLPLQNRICPSRLLSLMLLLLLPTGLLGYLLLL
jgi:hypothetical protein